MPTIHRSAATRRGFSALLVLVTASATAFALTTPASAAPPGQGDISFTNSVPKWASSALDAGPTAAGETVEGEVYLSLKDASGAKALSLAASNPADPQYGKYLSPGKWINQFAPTKGDFAAVEKYLRKSGLTIYATPQSRQYIVFRGPASAVGPAFNTTLHNYTYGGAVHYAPSSTPMLPSSIGGAVLGLSVDGGRAMTRPANVTPIGAEPTSSPKTGTLTPQALTALPKYTCSSYYGENSGPTPKAYGSKSFPTFLCGYLPDQLRSGYNLNKMIIDGNDGRGQTVAIIDAYASPTIRQDTNDYMLAVGSPLLTTFKEIKPKAFVDTVACAGAAGWQGEETLDVQSAHSIAPGANILYVGGFNCGGGLDIALSTVLDGGLANIVSNSYGDAGENVSLSYLLGQQNLEIQAAGEGIGLYYSSGDSGDESVNLGYVSPDFPASSPWVTAVGGTSEAFGASGSQVFATGWGSMLDQIVLNKNGNLAFAYKPLPGNLNGGGAGGGTSTMFAQPAYQKGVVPTALANAASDGTPIAGGPGRVVPDVAALADPYTGFQIAFRPITSCTPDGTCQTEPLQYVTYGGTSLASPITAAQMALIQQASGRTTGFANPALYAGYQAQPSLFNDVTTPQPPTALTYTSARSGNDYLVSLDQDSSLKTAPGYDNVTGLGELNVPAIASALSKGRN
ncbi:MAG: S53 family peptidase [Nakamurella sp.]